MRCWGTREGALGKGIREWRPGEQLLKQEPHGIREKLNAVSAALDTATLLELNTTLASPEKPDVAQVAQNWVTAEGLG